MTRRVVTPDGTFCGICGETTSLDATQCSFCGEAFTGDVPGVKCPSCSRVVDDPVPSCPSCGATLPEIQEISGANVLEELRAFRAQTREQMAALERLPSALPEIGEAQMQKDLEAMWKLSEPFEKIVSARRKRLEQMDRLIANARRRVKDLEDAEGEVEVRERDELKRQVQEVLLERDEILKIEYGINEMDRIYRNIITMQQQELRRKEDALKSRLDSVRREAERRGTSEQALDERERELERRERELEARFAAFEGKAKRAGDAGSPQGAPSNREEWLAAQKEIQGTLFKLRGMGEDVVVPTAASARDLRMKMTELEEALEKTSDERTRLEGELAELRSAEEDTREVFRVLDDLLGKLPDEEIRKFAKSDAFRRYERVLERAGL